MFQEFLDAQVTGEGELMSVKSEKLSKTVKMPVMEGMPTVLNIDLKKYPGFDYEIGETCSGSFSGKVTRISMDEYGHEMRIEIKKLKSDSTTKSDKSEDYADGESE